MGGFGWLWVVVGVVGGFGWLWVVVGGCGGCGGAGGCGLDAGGSGWFDTHTTIIIVQYGSWATPQL